MMAGTCSDWASVLSGVPHGSVLGPVLFICYINDMLNSVSSFIYMYVDDTKVSREVGSIQDHTSTSLQTYLNEIH